MRAAALALDCAGQDAGVGFNATIHKPARPQGPFEGAEAVLVDALKRGASVTFVTEEAINPAFSLSGSSEITNTLGCG